MRPPKDGSEDVEDNNVHFDDLAVWKDIRSSVTNNLGAGRGVDRGKIVLKELEPENPVEEKYTMFKCPVHKKFFEMG